jgi:hypothetical protein
LSDSLSTFFCSPLDPFSEKNGLIHPSLIEIKKQNDYTNKFVFEKITTDKVEKIINNINTKKATGADGIPAKIIKCSKYITILSDSLSTFFCSPLDPFSEKNGLIVFQNSPDFVPPEQRSKKYVFIDFLFNLFTKVLCFLNFSKFLVIKGEILHEPKKLRYYRSYKTFDIENFNDDIEQIKFNQTCHEVDSTFDNSTYNVMAVTATCWNIL